MCDGMDDGMVCVKGVTFNDYLRNAYVLVLYKEVFSS